MILNVIPGRREAAVEGGHGVTSQCHSGATRSGELQMFNCTSGNLQIPGPVLRTIPE